MNLTIISWWELEKNSWLDGPAMLFLDTGLRVLTRRIWSGYSVVEMGPTSYKIMRSCYTPAHGKDQTMM